ncbi:MAG: hypothetical protein K6B74_08560, partial [Ruminococcus sp.]|nr:hypothetical protein [Ruminococcus sp.]
MKKKILSLALATVLALSMTACGGSGSSEPTEKDFEKAAEKLDSMKEEDFEKEVEKKAEKLDNMTEEDLEKDLEGVDGGEETTSSAEKKEGYEPCQEILDADFTSGLIQIGNDVFKCGGYLTVSDLVEQYGDRYDFDVDLNKTLADDETEGKFEFKHKTNDIKINALYCKHGKTLGEAVAYDFEGNIARTFFPKGLKSLNNWDSPNDIKEKATNIFKTYFDTENILEYGDIKETDERPLPENFWYLDSIKKYFNYNGE